ncbi:hypothetical protein V7114_02990 [Neobacillus niacini]|uniref:hypothetical protein n=1 Tax=Neobacillus niacini TaxID=86668 RepID=UPI002FFD6961
MRLLDVQPKKNFSYIFIQFQGMKMNVPKHVDEEVALCIQLNSKEKVKDLFFVPTQSIKPFDFTDEAIGAKAFFRVIKKKDSSPDSLIKEIEDVVTFISEEVAIVQKKSKAGYHFVLEVNKCEFGMIASIEEEVLPTEKVSLPFEEKEKEVVVINRISMKVKENFGKRSKQKRNMGGSAFQDDRVLEPIRILAEDVKRKFTVFSPAALDFIGPGDSNQLFYYEGMVMDNIY